MFFLKNQLNINWLAIIMAIATIGTAFSSGNMPQANSISKVLYQTFGLKEYISGGIISIVIGFIILGGIKRIGALAEKLIPLMTFIFLIISIIVIITHYKNLIPSLKAIFGNPLSGRGAIGGFIGASLNIIIREGVNRSLFTNEAGSGSSGMAHASSEEANSFNEGVASILEPFFSTALMCTLTALVILTAGTWNTKFKNKFDHTDITIFKDKFTDNTTDLKKLNDHFYDNKKLPLYNKNMKIENGKIVNQDITIVNLNSIGEDIIITKNGHNFTGNILIKSGKISSKDKELIFTGKSIVTGPLPASIAFNTTILGNWGSHLLNLCIILFGLTTVLAWFYYGDRSLIFLGANKQVLLLFKIIYSLSFLVGSITSLTIIWSLGTIFYALMGIPCIIGTLLLRKQIKNITNQKK